MTQTDNPHGEPTKFFPHQSNKLFCKKIRMKKRTKIVIWIGASLAGLAVFAYISLLVIGSLIFGSLDPFSDEGSSSISWRSSLPETATDIEEQAWSDGFLPDYDYYLRARITESEFEKFVKDLELTPHSDTRIYSESSLLSWSGALIGDKEWWNPTEYLEGTYVKEGGTNWTFAKYEDGFLYFRSLDH
jgi:hypothetical protein